MRAGRVPGRRAFILLQRSMCTVCSQLQNIIKEVCLRFGLFLLCSYNRPQTHPRILAFSLHFPHTHARTHSHAQSPILSFLPRETQDPGKRNIAPLCIPGDLAAAAKTLAAAKSVAILSGYPCCLADPPTETDGPPGALAVARALVHLYVCIYINICLCIHRLRCARRPDVKILRCLHIQYVSICIYIHVHSGSAG